MLFGKSLSWTFFFLYLKSIRLFILKLAGLKSARRTAVLVVLLNVCVWECVCVCSLYFGTNVDIIIIVIIIIIAFKGAIQAFLQSPHSVANWLQHLCSSGPGATVCKSRATHWALITCKCHVTCHLVRMDSSAIKFDRVEIAFIWALFYWLNHYTGEGGEETGVPWENSWRRASENATYCSPKIQALSETQTRAVALVAG